MSEIKEYYGYCFLPKVSTKETYDIQLSHYRAVNIDSGYSVPVNTSNEEIDTHLTEVAREYFRSMDGFKLPETLPDELEKELEFFTTYDEDHHIDPQQHVQHEIKIKWQDVCIIYEKLRELIIEGKIG